MYVYNYICMMFYVCLFITSRKSLTNEIAGKASPASILCTVSQYASSTF